MRVIAVDIDDTVIGSKGERLPFADKVDELFENPDHFIVMYTARSYSIFHQTKAQLDAAGIKYHALVMEKIRASIYYDDKGEKV